MRYPEIREKANKISNKIADIPDHSRLSSHRKRLIDAYDKTRVLYWELEEKSGDTSLFQASTKFKELVVKYLFNPSLREAKYFILRELNIIACYENP